MSSMKLQPMLCTCRGSHKTQMTLQGSSSLRTMAIGYVVVKQLLQVYQPATSFCCMPCLLYHLEAILTAGCDTSGLDHCSVVPHIQHLLTNRRYQVMECCFRCHVFLMATDSADSSRAEAFGPISKLASAHVELRHLLHCCSGILDCMNLLAKLLLSIDITYSLFCTSLRYAHQILLQLILAKLRMYTQVAVTDLGCHLRASSCSQHITMYTL